MHAIGDLARPDENPNQVLEWNQIFIDTLIATNTANSSSQRLGAIVHTAIFDAYNGIERRYTPIFVQPAPRRARRDGPRSSLRRTRALVGLFPSRQAALDESYAASLAALSDDGGDGGQIARARHRLGHRGRAGRARVARDRRVQREPIPPFTGGTAVGQWRPTPPAFGPMSAQGLAFTAMFVLDNNTQFQPPPPRGLTSSTYTDDFNAVKALGRRTGSTRTTIRPRSRRSGKGNASVHWNQAANQIARANHLSMSGSNRLLAVLNIAMADTAFTTWSGKRYYGANPTEVTWRPVTAIPLADSDGNPDTVADPDWLPLINTPSHPEYPAGHPSLNGAAATVLLSHFDDAPDVYADDRPAEPHLHQHRAGALGREQRPGLGRHALPEHRRDQRCRGRGDRDVRQSTRDADESGDNDEWGVDSRT